MQDTESVLDNGRRLGVDEQHIKFRPSPNFKNMKKFLKYKKDLESSSQSPPNASSDEATPNSAPESSPNQEKFLGDLHLKRQSPERQNIQPPLPLDPPPPYTTALFPIPLKQEVIDEEYSESGQESPNLTAAATEQSQPELNIEPQKKPEEHDSSSQEICRDYIRGTCVRENCIFAHRFDRSILYKAYTFCKNYQNVRCTYPYCRYVHATVFEEQEFYRTGVLPPHALNNLPYYFMPPPPPPPPPSLPDVTPSLQTTNATSPLQAQSYLTVPKAESKTAVGFGNMTNVVSLKREWSANSFSVPPRALDNKENIAKKCKNCDTMDIRLQDHKDEIKIMKQSSEELKAKSTLLNKKTDALFTVLFTVLKSQVASIEGMNGLMTTLNNCGEKEKALIQHILHSHRGGNTIK